MLRLSVEGQEKVDNFAFLTDSINNFLPKNLDLDC